MHVFDLCIVYKLLYFHPICLVLDYHLFHTLLIIDFVKFHHEYSLSYHDPCLIGHISVGNYIESLIE